jgi:hypothetical protein
MKKTVISALIIVFAYCNTNAQFKMATNGNSFFASTPTPNAFTKLGIGFSSSNYESGSNSNYSLFVTNTPITTYNLHYYGILASTYCQSPTTGFFNVGIYGQAGNSSTDGFNFGVAGFLIGSQDGTGIFGAQRGSGFTSISGNWAGYFYGNVKTIGTIYANAFTLNSDQQLKKNVSPLINSTYNKIIQLNAVQYQYKTRQELKTAGVIASSDTSTIDESQITHFNKIHFGFIGQDFQNIFPELVYKGKDSLLSIDYIGLIPLMIEVLKQQEKKITQLQLDLDKCCSSTEKSSLKSTDTVTNKTESAVLYQNTPNPFNNETQIKCFIPDNANVSNIYIYNLQGTQIKRIQINGKGYQTIIIQSSELNAGIYMYSLIIDGIEIDTKKMILTD